MTPQEAIQEIKSKVYCNTDDCEITISKDCYKAVLNALKKQIQEKPIFHEEKHGCHNWKKCDDGSIDDFAVESGYCNGPICERCGYSFCEHCHPNGYNDTECTVQYYTCPICEKQSANHKNTVIADRLLTGQKSKLSSARLIHKFRCK